MTRLRRYDACLLLAVELHWVAHVLYDGPVRMFALRRGPRWWLLARSTARLASAASILHATLVLGVAAGVYDDGRALGAPVLRFAFGPLVRVMVFRLSAAGAATPARRRRTGRTAAPKKGKVRHRSEAARH